uniref:Uncharacterized protein n=1 Tax=Ditylenchus dipsaci TaxID=166011 RepID=A0A915DUA5_9BILA
MIEQQLLSIFATARQRFFGGPEEMSLVTVEKRSSSTKHAKDGARTRNRQKRRTIEDERRSIDPGSTHMFIKQASQFKLFRTEQKAHVPFPRWLLPYDGCKKAVIKHSKNLYRHMKNKHNSELEKVILEIDKAETRLPFDVISTTNRPLRYLTMYGGTSTFAFAHLENPWLLRLLGTCKGMTCIPNRRALRTLVGGELKKVQNKLKIICENVTHGLSFV